MAITASDIHAMATRIMLDLGAGYSESIYQRALFNQIAKVDGSAALERTMPVVYDGQPIGTCRADIVTAHQVIEIKALRRMPAYVDNQIQKYVKHMHEQDARLREGIVINFNQQTGIIDFMTVAAPAPSTPAHDPLA